MSRPLTVDDGLVVVKPGGEIAVAYDDVGALFISKVAGSLVVEAVAIANPGEPRPVVQKRHAQLLAFARELFGDFEHHDPLNLTGVATSKAVAS